MMRQGFSFFLIPPRICCGVIFTRFQIGLNRAWVYFPLPLSLLRLFYQISLGYTEPYAELVAGTTKSTMSTPRSAVKKMKSANPTFQQMVTIEIKDPSKDKLHLSFFDVDDNEAPILIGETKISLQQLKRGTEQSTWYRLVNCLSGDVHVSLMPIDFDTVASVSSTPTQPPMSSAPLVTPHAGWPPTARPAAVPNYPGVPSGSSGANSYQQMQMPQMHHHMAQQPPMMAPPAHSPVQYPPSVQPLGYPGAAQPMRVNPKPTVVNPNELLMTSDPNAAQSPSQPQSLPQVDPKWIQRDFPHIAKGSFGVVFTGHVQSIKVDKVVIKDMEVHNQRNIDDWKKEIAMMARMRSPYVVQVLGYCSSGHILTIVMEYMRKGSLYDVLHQRKEPLSLLQRMRMARQCALSVAHLHSAAVIHRDIKSMNILCTEDYVCKLTDFGCAKLINDRSLFNTANSGTPLWMAPEVRAGQYDYSADVYSLGLVLYELFENKLPFYDQLRQCVVLPKQFQSASVVLPCVAAKPSSRPTAAQVVKVLDMMIRNVVGKVRKHLPPEEEYLLFSGPAAQSAAGSSDTDIPEDFDTELKRLYTHLLTKNPAVVDQLISRVFNQPSSPTSSPAPSLHNSAEDLLGGFHSAPVNSAPMSPQPSPSPRPAPVPGYSQLPIPSPQPSAQYYVPMAAQPAVPHVSAAAYPPPGAPTTTPSLLAGLPTPSSSASPVPRTTSAIDDLLGMDLTPASANTPPMSHSPLPPAPSNVLNPPIASHRSNSPANSSSNALYPALEAAGAQGSASLKDWEWEKLTTELNKMSIYDLRNLLYNHNVDESQCFSKAELVDLAKKSTSAPQLYRTLVRTTDSASVHQTQALSAAETSRAADMFAVYSEGASEIPRDMAILILSDLLRGRMPDSEIQQRAKGHSSMASSAGGVSRDSFLALYQHLLTQCQILV